MLHTDILNKTQVKTKSCTFLCPNCVKQCVFLLEDWNLLAMIPRAQRSAVPTPDYYASNVTNCTKKIKLFHFLKCVIDILLIKPLKIDHINLKAFVVIHFMPAPERYSVRLCSLCPLSIFIGWQKGFIKPFYKLGWFPPKGLLSFTYMIAPHWSKTSVEAALKPSHTQENVP